QQHQFQQDDLATQLQQPDAVAPDGDQHHGGAADDGQQQEGAPVEVCPVTEKAVTSAGQADEVQGAQADIDPALAGKEAG
ncbi:hypothetical protein, partial [Thiolapillus sp.]|uniref:hypothetical protein n=1 Tax=Thiolapillus sp. TaxID=2017437 RepID=UPI003AF86AAE